MRLCLSVPLLPGPSNKTGYGVLHSNHPTSAALGFDHLGGDSLLRFFPGILIVRGFV